TKTKGLRKPIDKKSNYVKRCVGTPGDSLSIINGNVHINGKELMLSDRAKLQYNHAVYSKQGVSSNILRENGSTDFLRSYILKPLSNQAQVDALSPYLKANPVTNEDGSITIYTDQNGIPYQVLREYQINAQEVLEPKRVANLTLE